MAGGALTIQTALGPMTLRYTAQGIRELDLGRPAADTPQPPRYVLALAAQLQRYAAGEPLRFTVALDLASGTAFQRRIWELLRQIPYGQTRSYSWLAKQAGSPAATRAAGAACGANPVPILIPCHRIVRADGALGGFSAGLDWKRRLLALEGIPQRP